MFDGVFFDCDGVLFESKAANLAFYNVVLEAFGEPTVQPDDIDKVTLCHTAASKEVLETLLGPERGPQALHYAATLGYEAFIPKMQPEAGMHQTLNRLSKKLPLAVATNRGNSIGPILSYFELAAYFKTVVCCLDVDTPKPAPDMLLLGLERLALDAERVLFVGDSILDRQAAAAAGMPFAAFRTDVGGDYSVEGFAQLEELFSSSG